MNRQSEQRLNFVNSDIFSLALGVPKEIWHGERRVAITPSVSATLIKKGFTVNVESGAGLEANFKDAGLYFIIFGWEIVLSYGASFHSNPLS